jgi:hypothetical protein
MKIACLMCALWMSSALAFQAAIAATAPLEGAPAERGPTESSDASPAARTQSHGPARVSSAQGAVPKADNTVAIVPLHPAAARRGAGQLGRSTSDRLHSLLRAQAKPVAKLPGRPAAASTRGTPGTTINRTPGFQGAGPASLSRLAVSNIPARAPQSTRLPTRGALIGGPHPASPALGRRAAANRAALDGAQMRRRF